MVFNLRQPTFCCIGFFLGSIASGRVYRDIIGSGGGWQGRKRVGSQVFFRGEEKKSDLLASTKIEQIIRQPRVLNQKMLEINHALYQLYKIDHDQDQFAVLKIRPSFVNFTRDRKLTLSKKNT